MSIAYSGTPMGAACSAPPALSWVASIAAHTGFFALIAFWGEVGPLPALPEADPLEVTFATPALPTQNVAKPVMKAVPHIKLAQPKVVPATVRPDLDRQATAHIATGTSQPAASPIPVAAPPVISMPSSIATAAAPTTVPAIGPASPQAIVATNMVGMATPTPAAPAMPTASETAHATTAAIQAHWHDKLARKLHEMKRYPMAARRLGQEGVVVIGLQVSGDGIVADIRIRQGSDYPILDQAALRLVREATAALRDTPLTGRSAQLEIPIAYRLREG